MDKSREIEQQNRLREWTTENREEAKEIVVQADLLNGRGWELFLVFLLVIRYLICWRRNKSDGSANVNWKNNLFT